MNFQLSKYNRLVNFFQYIFPLAIIFSLILVELISIWYFKVGGGAYRDANNLTIVEYLRIYGGIEFYLAAYIDRLAATILLGYIVITIMLSAKVFKDKIFPDSIDRRVFRFFSLKINIISFFLLALLFFFIRNPEDLVSNPYSFLSIIYSLNPIIWLIFLYSVLDLIFPVSDFSRLVIKNKIFSICIFLFTVVIRNPEVPEIMDASSQFWSNLLLKSTISLAFFISHVMGIDVNILPDTSDGIPVFGTTRFHVEIWPACAGYEGMSIAVVLLALYCWIERGRLAFPKSLAIIPLAGLCMFLLNAFRISILIAIGNYWSPDIALNGFHSVAGWLNLIVVLFFSVFALQRTSFFLKRNKLHQSMGLVYINTVYLFPLTILISSSLITKSITADFNWLYPVPIAISTLVSLYFWRSFKPILTIPSILSVITGIAIFLLWLNLIPVDVQKNYYFSEQINSAPILISMAWILCRIIGAVIIVPFAEEMAFRGFLMPFFEGYSENFFRKFSVLNISFNYIMWFSMCFSILITSLLFGLLHSEILAGSIAGLGYCLVYLHRRKLMDAIFSHAVTNFLLAINVIYFGNWSYW